MDVSTILSDFERLKANCEQMAGKKIIVGIVGSADSEVIKIAQAHEYGTGRLPERSFIRASFDAEQEQLCEIVSGQVNRVKPQSDFSKKTQHTTLFETGTHIRDRIAYKVEG